MRAPRTPPGSTPSRHRNRGWPPKACPCRCGMHSLRRRSSQAQNLARQCTPGARGMHPWVGWATPITVVAGCTHSHTPGATRRQQRHTRHVPRAKRHAQCYVYAPAGHTVQDCAPNESLYLPAWQTHRSPATQYSPRAHTAEPVRVAGETPPSGVEYHPAATARGAPDAGGQNTVAFPHGAAVSFTEPGGQK